MRKLILKIFPFLVILITIISIQSYLSINYLNLVAATWIIEFLTVYIIFIYKKKINNQISHYITRTDLHIITIYFIWVIFNSIRGGFIASNYWEWKQLIMGVLNLSLPLFLYPFTNAQIVFTTDCYSISCM